MPVELAMPLLLPNDDFQNRKISKFKRPLRPCLHLRQIQPGFNSPLQQSEWNGASQPSGVHGKAKKRVSFADHKGLDLTMVKIFSEFDDPIAVPLSIQEHFTSVLTVSEEESELVLNFAQPSADYLQFRQRLEENFVSLEHCTLKDRAVVGTVKVKNLSFEKSVKVRATFDTWKTCTDVDCHYVNDTYSGSEWDTFSLEVDLPEQMRPHERVEFAVFYVVNGLTYWDNNLGQNYRIIHSALKKSSNDLSVGYRHYGTSDWDVYFDRYGSPRCSHGIFPEWPSYAGYEDLGPYY
ncbi:protein phosphatase 1 regulatory subunit 3B [Electrophorus electricus]|uniref:Protein phosphatase 1 regulatory subunit n=1 Tax=Electrophorus electricus TaxID=8005 RepID=A0A4W4GFK5_ELEEL|nr:protein phosphatase 1 regulatory subunit 3B [Electrophorus electricus]